MLGAYNILERVSCFLLRDVCVSVLATCHILKFMQHRKSFARALFFLFLLTCLLAGLVGVVRVPVDAAPQMLQGATNIVISEFRPSGQGGASDEFIELFNPTGSAIDITGWLVKKSGGCSGISATPLATITLPTVLQPGQYYLIANTASSYVNIADITYSSTIAGDGGVAITLADGTPVDEVGLCATTGYLEGTALSPLTTNVNRSYERSDGSSAGSCFDSNNNATDFRLITPSDPQNSGSQPIPCLVVTNVTSSALDYPPNTYIAGNTIDITIEFSSAVNVTGIPKLSLNSGGDATYLPPVNLNIVTFQYTVGVGDVTGDLDYVSTDSLVLNGGTITGAVGNAVLTLPSPGATGSLGANKNIVIDNGAPPSILSFTHQIPSSNPTRADSIMLRATFSEPVTNVDAADFAIHDNTPNPTTTAAITSVNPVNNGYYYDITISGGDLAGFNGIVGLDLSGSQNITDAVSNPLPAGEPAIDETYTVDNAPPTIAITLATGQAASANATPVNFTVTFSEAINASTFTASDITQAVGATATFITWNIASTANPQVFDLSATTIGGNGTVTPVILATQVEDLAGNSNTLDSSTATVTFTDNVPPTGTITRASGQASSTNSLPIKFTVVFSEPIIASIFTPSDITQATGATATGITWVITNSGDNQTFTLTATSVTGSGTLKPLIAANRVTDPVGNNNLEIVSADVVTYSPPPTSTPRPTSTPFVYKTSTPRVPPPPPLLAINEFVPRPGHDWNNDGIINTGDEYIELLNHGVVDVNLSGYRLDDEANIGSSPFSLPSITLKPGERIVFYGSQTGLLLSDGGDGVRLLKSNGQLVDAYNYSVVNFPDQAFCRLPDDGGLDDWNTNCYPTPGLRNSLSGSLLRPPTQSNDDEPLCPIADTLPQDFVLAECAGFGNNIWNRYYWDKSGWYGEMLLPNTNSKWGVFAD